MEGKLGGEQRRVCAVREDCGRKAMNEPSNRIQTLQERASRLAALSSLRDMRIFTGAFNFVRFPGDDLTFDLEVSPSARLDDEDDFFVVEVEYEVKIRKGDPDPAEDKDAGTIANLEFTIAALYTLELRGATAPDDEELDAFSKSAAMLAVHPYAREFVQSMTSRMGLPPLTLDMIRIEYPRASNAATELGGDSDLEPPRRAIAE
jgi:preprotein translocase subunit SecB